MLTLVMIVSIIIVFVIILVSVLTTSKAYSYRHTVDPVKTLDEVEEDKKKGNH